MRVIALTVAAMAASGAWAADLACKTGQGLKCVCSNSNPRKCAHTAKAICLSGKIIEPAAGSLLTAHENNMEIFKACQEYGGLKEIVFNKPLTDTFHSASPNQATAATSKDD